MVKVKTPGRAAFRTPPITKFFPRAQNHNENSELSPISNKHDNDNENSLYKRTPPSGKSVKKYCESPKRNKSECTSSETVPESQFNATSLKNLQVNNQTDPILISDDDEKSIPEVIEDDEDDDLLSKASFNIPMKGEKCVSVKEESSEIIENNLRRSSRPRRVVFQEGFVSTAEAIPAKGDIPMLDASPSSTKENYTAKTSYQNSLSALLREKRIRDKAGYNINVLEQALVNDMLDEMEDPFDNYDRSEIPTTILDENMKFEQLRQILEEDDKLDRNHHIEFFRTSNLIPQTPNLETSTLNNGPTFDLLLKAHSDEEKLKDILCNNWIASQFEIGWQLPAKVIVWLLHLASYGEDIIISEASFNTLKNIAETKGRHSYNEAEDINVPFSEIYNILIALGASTQMISSRHCLEHDIIQSSLSEIPYKFYYLNNVRQLLKTIVLMIDNRLFTFSSSEEIRSAVVILLRLPLDRRLLSLSSEIGQAVNSLLAMFQEDQWIEQARLAYDDIKLSCGSITQFKVTILENLPISDRGRLLRRFFAFRFLFDSESLLSHQIKQLNIFDVTNPDILKSLLELFQDINVFKIKDETNYSELYNYVLFLGYTLDNESQLIKAKDTVEEIIKKLKYLHGKIVDMRAAFMERTKAKDLIQRLYMRLHYILSVHRRGKTQTSIRFYSQKN